MHILFKEKWLEQLISSVISEGMMVNTQLTERKTLCF